MSNEERGTLGNIKERMGLSKEKAVAQGIKVFITEQDPVDVDFVEYENGWALEVKTDSKSVEEAREFWENEVRPRL